jgi:hypothetical protein
MSSLQRITCHIVTGFYSGGRFARYIGVRSQSSDTLVRRQLTRSLAPDRSGSHRNSRCTERMWLQQCCLFMGLCSYISTWRKRNFCNALSYTAKCLPSSTKDKYTFYKFNARVGDEYYLKTQDFATKQRETLKDLRCITACNKPVVIPLANPSIVSKWSSLSEFFVRWRNHINKI